MVEKCPVPQISVLTTTRWVDYILLDSGDGKKLEQFGRYVFVRPEVQAVWSPKLAQQKWDAADGLFIATGEEHGGHWQFRRQVAARWKMAYPPLQCWIQPGAARHLGVFPEQATQWDWIMDGIREAGREVNILNLFGYTGMASLAAAVAGARVTHVDASPKSVAWAKENQALCGLQQKPIRWLVDDAIKFVRREARRGSKYDAIILDPPKFGRGPKGEVWEFFAQISALLADCRAILSEQPLFIVLTAYAVKSSALTLYGAMMEQFGSLGGRLECGEIGTVEQSAGRVLSQALYGRVRW